jgi:glycosidase
MATSPSPFAPVSLTEIEPSLGGETAFRELVVQANALEIKVIVDGIPHLSHKSTVVPEAFAVQCVDAPGIWSCGPPLTGGIALSETADRHSRCIPDR